MKTAFLFVYGTLRLDTRHKMANWLAKRADFIGNGCYQGRLYKIGNYPGAVPSDKVSDQVHGVVYHLRFPAFILDTLDAYEECAPNFPEPTEYARKRQPIRMQAGNTLAAWIYLYNWPTEKLKKVHSGNF